MDRCEFELQERLLFQACKGLLCKAERNTNLKNMFKKKSWKPPFFWIVTKDKKR